VRRVASALNLPPAAFPTSLTAATTSWVMLAAVPSPTVRQAFVTKQKLEAVAGGIIAEGYGFNSFEPAPFLGPASVTRVSRHAVAHLCRGQPGWHPLVAGDSPTLALPTTTVQSWEAAAGSAFAILTGMRAGRLALSFVLRMPGVMQTYHAVSERAPQQVVRVVVVDSSVDGDVVAPWRTCGAHDLVWLRQKPAYKPGGSPADHIGGHHPDGPDGSDGLSAGNLGPADPALIARVEACPEFMTFTESRCDVSGHCVATHAPSGQVVVYVQVHCADLTPCGQPRLPAFLTISGPCMLKVPVKPWDTCEVLRQVPCCKDA
jgi:hypothetical protein